MKVASLIVASILAALMAASCRTAAPPPPIATSGEGTKELAQKGRELNQAFALRDTAAIERLLAPEYVFHFIDQNMTGALAATPNAPRGRWVGEAFAHLSNGPLESSVVDVRLVGDVGVVVSHYRWSGTFNGTGFRYEGYITDTWVRRQGEWQVLLSTATLLPSP
jgi:hypothetical protein